MSSQKPSTIEARFEQENINLIKKHDVLLLLQHLAEREEITVKIILDSIYEIGSANLINNKFRSRPLKILVGKISKLSKPAFRVVAYYWFKKNCPQLITDWLIEQVAFEPAITKVVEVEANSTPESIQKVEQIKQLRSQVRLLTGILITVVMVFSSSFVWLFYDLKPNLFVYPKPTSNSKVSN